jgi:hypothetical protein
LNEKKALATINEVKSLILPLREHKIILDRDLASLYKVETRILVRAVQRNIDRFPDDFVFQLDQAEAALLVKNAVRLKNLKFSRRPPYAFTEHGTIMAAGVLNSPTAVEASVFVVRAFVKLRQVLTAHKELASKVAELERKLGDHDEAIRSIIGTIKRLMEPAPVPSKPKIGFR